MNNLFIVNTPLQLLTAYILSHPYRGNTNNHLLLLNPKGYNSWDDSTCLKRMVNDKETWRYVTAIKGNEAKKIFKDLGPRGALKKFHEIVNKQGVVDQVYLGSDITIFNQLAVELAGHTSYSRFDEGIGSYYSSGNRRVSTQIAEWVTIKLLKFVAGIRSNMKYNFKGMGRGQAATADYLYKPHLLQRSSPNPVSIDRNVISSVLDNLTAGVEPYSELDSKNVILYLGSRLAEFNYFTQETEISLLRELSQMARNYGLTVWYKTHPGEKRYKLKIYQEKLSDVYFFNSFEPIEIIYYLDKRLKSVVSYFSSGMIYADIFARHNIIPISTYKVWREHLTNLVPDKTANIIETIMCDAGVLMPASKKDLEKIIASIMDMSNCFEKNETNSTL